MQIFVASNPDALATAINALDGPTGTVEAEYGDVVVEGSAFTLAHHGARSGNAAPCLTEAGSLPIVEAIGLSHVDLDALMGVGIAMGRSYPRPFAGTAAFIDTRGPHKAPQAPEWGSQERLIQAWWAWSEENRCYPPRDGSVEDVTEFVETALDVLDRILAGDEELLAVGALWAEKVSALNVDSFIETAYPAPGGILLRQSEQFVNHLYAAPDGVVHQVVVAHNPEQGSVTLSFANPENFTNPDFGFGRVPSDAPAPARYFVQKLWGGEAGGHAGIAGSPRDATLTLDDARELVELIKPYF